ncbi:MAG: bifunctional proline dehydrogenase/L-glutamate gamma-semialdehyde dehydrogenase PutA [Gammaproteobacteria bacterium]|nr:bifunctional proline dehydrogenase/L-glutamate gamma-semialdehyde dehydrogenase PutA [Gammaproteobacteria bacterium]
MFLTDQALSPQPMLREKITQAYRQDETVCLAILLNYACFSATDIEAIQAMAAEFVKTVRDKRFSVGGIDAFMHQYSLSSEEGIALMCLAEALLRIPDNATRDKLIRDKLGTAQWQSHAGQSHSLFVNAATWGLMLTGTLYNWGEASNNHFSGVLKKLALRSGEPFIRQAVGYAMQIMGKQFVMGSTIESAIKRAKTSEAKGYRYSYDMLGEAARTDEDADGYFQSYEQAIHAIGQDSGGRGPLASPGISIKLSALYPRYEYAKKADVMLHLAPKVLQLATLAKQYDIGFTIDAEEAERLDLSLDLIEVTLTNSALDGWQGFGLALQAYQKRAFWVIDWLADLAKRTNHRIMLRLVKGAYWDAEIKLSQEKGLAGYPVFTRKTATDVSYLACAKKIINYGTLFYPQFATHNAYTVAAIMQLMKDHSEPYEFQCLHGMGQTLYDEIVDAKTNAVPCRIYAPVGTQENLLAYLVRRLLENGANTSFVNRIVDEKEPIEQLVADPCAKLKEQGVTPHPGIPLPIDLYGHQRKNSRGLDMTDNETLIALQKALDAASQLPWHGGPIINGNLVTGEKQPVMEPSHQSTIVGTVVLAETQHIEQALISAKNAALRWDQTPAVERAAYLDKAADLLETQSSFFMALAIREAGKTINDAMAEVREAVDFCRYYAVQAREHFDTPLELKGPTGESNHLELHGRGVIACISPWNFPLAIFMGQVTAALAAGNCVVAKPAEQTPLIASYAVQLLHQAGIPVDVLHLLPGRGEVVGAALVNDIRVNGIMFTGSTSTARFINQALAQRSGPIVPLIAETGGQNVMIVDSSALAEQVVADVLLSAFGSAGQRCSALRVLFLQEDIADRVIEMLKGAMALLSLGDPGLLATDIGPVIDQDALAMLESHLKKIQEKGQLIYQVALEPALRAEGHYFAPCAVEIPSLSLLEGEVFGPFLHIIRYKASALDEVIAAINETGYGLTLGIHTRIEETQQYIHQRTQVGNTYVNRGMTGAVVGVQPFGGEGLSGTGPKAGGPHYLLRLCTERVMTINTTAAGGNASLMSLGE